MANVWIITSSPTAREGAAAPCWKQLFEFVLEEVWLLSVSVQLSEFDRSFECLQECISYNAVSSRFMRRIMTVEQCTRESAAGGFFTV